MKNKNVSRILAVILSCSMSMGVSSLKIPAAEASEIDFEHMEEDFQVEVVKEDEEAVIAEMQAEEIAEDFGWIEDDAAYAEETIIPEEWEEADVNDQEPMEAISDSEELEQEIYTDEAESDENNTEEEDFFQDGTAVQAAEVATSGKCGDNATWKYEKGVLTISGTGAIYNGSDIENGWKEFNRLDDSSAYPITKIVIEDGITSIGDYSFTWINEYVDGDVKAELTIGKDVKVIGDEAFVGSNISEILLPDSVEKIGNAAFASCKATSITLGANVKEIGGEDWNWFGTFSGMPFLKNIYVSSKNPYYTSVDGALYNKEQTKLIMYPPAKKVDGYTFPNTLKIIGKFAFGYNCSTGFKIPSGVEEIQYGAVCESEILTLYIPASVKAADCLKPAIIGYKKLNRVYFGGDIPAGSLGEGTSLECCYYPENNKTWTPEAIKNFQAYCETKWETWNPGKNISSCSASVSVRSYIYDGTEKKPAVVVKDGDKTLKENVDYTIVYKDNIMAGIGSAEITGQGNYSGKLAKTFKITTSIPAIQKVESVKTGVKISWNKAPGAKKYRVFRKNSSGKWEKTGDTAGSSFTDQNVKSGTKYTYTVRCVSSDGKEYVSEYNKTGKSIVYLSAPVLTDVANQAKGVKVSWKGVIGAVKYAVFRKEGSGSWKKVDTTTGTSYTDQTSKSGVEYTYSVRCTTNDGKIFTSGYDAAGKRIQYIEAPIISSLTNIVNGVTIKWNKTAGAVKYRVYRKENGGGWKKVGDTTGTAYTDKTAQGGNHYQYTLRCVTKDGKTFTSFYIAAGKKIIHIKAPAITKIETTSNGLRINWNPSAGARKYGVFRKDASGKWKKIGTTASVSYTDTTAVNGVNNTYTIRCLEDNGKDYVSAYDSNGISKVYLTSPSVAGITGSEKNSMTVKWSKNGSAAGYEISYTTGSTTKTMKVTGAEKDSAAIKNLASGTTYKVKVRTYKTVNGKTYYSTWSTTVPINVTKAGVLVDTEGKKQAEAVLNSIGWDLRKAFNWSSGTVHYWTMEHNPPAGYAGTQSEYFALKGFANKRGNCYVMASTFYKMAQLLGYEAYFVKGAVPLAGGSMGGHGWVEVIINGATYVCDPSFANGTGRNGYMITYGTPGTWRYSSYARYQ